MLDARRWRWPAIATFLTVALAASAYGSWRASGRSLAEQPPPPPVPVETARVVRRDVQVHLTGIGTVTPFNTVTVRSRVDGELQQVLFREGQDIRKGDLIAVIDPRLFQATLDQAKAKLAQDEASLANARLNLGRDTKLGKDAFASQQMIDNESSSVDQFVAQIAQDRAMIDNAQTQLSYTHITSPIDGRAGIRLVDQGNIVHAADAGGLVVINQIHPISVISTLPQTDVPAIRAALAAGKVQALATSHEDGSTLDVGSVELIDNQIDPQSGTVRLKSVFPNRNDALWPGQFVDVQTLVATLSHVLTVPSDAVQRGPDGPYVYVVADADTVAAAPVKVGQIADHVAVIEDGLAEGQQVVVRGQYRLAPGARVAPSTPAAPAGS
ncbi:efflux RND transporter periplasmic adaptor subunit [Ancylobacter dichloromethanicus]|uniref:Multidrug resistance protein n=1 Tax=Ancylobacter dichloromethanicus TaxID=518825 RepID=A0A9W6JA96_9HYPH|nr:efflux RND transporter periplasmic adaptor subunit [Ancylobacter dichloromethanicus]MBS7556724.1 efflux RND transporter periplasmic adaptor subunit [Ancylobacter dichloromethanicus]GLK73577.1 multidrug resistance protein [Ancylobacter dichloromethanicus]